jgi:hypothetical protein
MVLGGNGTLRRAAGILGPSCCFGEGWGRKFGSGAQVKFLFTDIDRDRTPFPDKPNLRDFTFSPEMFLSVVDLVSRSKGNHHTQSSLISFPAVWRRGEIIRVHIRMPTHLIEFIPTQPRTTE